MQPLTVDFICSLDGYGAAEGWPGWWGMESAEYLQWLEESPEQDHPILMGAKTYRLMSELAASGEPGTDVLADMPKVVFSSSLTEPLAWPNTTLVSGDAVVTLDPSTGESGPRLMSGAGTAETDTARHSLLKLRDVDARLLLPGHGPVWSGVGAAIELAMLARS